MSQGFTPPGLWIAVGVLAVFSIAWMLTLVPFGRGVLGRTKPARARLRPWSAVHSLAWCGVAVSIGWLVFSGGTSAYNILLGGLFMVGIPAAEAGLLWFGRALQNGQKRAVVAPASSAPATAPPAQKRAARVEPAPTSRGQPGSAGSWLGWLPMLAAVVLVDWFAQHSRFIQTESLGLHRHEPLLLGIVIPVTVLGFAMFMLGGVQFVFAAGRPMTRAEIESQISTAHLVGVPYWQGGFKSRVFGNALGQQAGETLGMSEFKVAWRAGAGWSSLRWRAIFLLVGGGMIMVFAGLGIAVVAGPADLQLISAFAVIYGAIRLARAWAQA